MPVRASDTLGHDNGGDSGSAYLGNPRSACDSQVHSPPALVSGFHRSPTLWTPLRRLLVLFSVFGFVFWIYYSTERHLCQSRDLG